MAHMFWVDAFMQYRLPKYIHRLETFVLISGKGLIQVSICGPAQTLTQHFAKKSCIGHFHYFVCVDALHTCQEIFQSCWDFSWIEPVLCRR